MQTSSSRSGDKDGRNWQRDGLLTAALWDVLKISRTGGSNSLQYNTTLLLEGGAAKIASFSPSIHSDSAESEVEKRREPNASVLHLNGQDRRILIN